MEVKGDYFYAQFFVKRGSVNQDATVQTFEIVSGTGRWEELVGQKCIGAYTPLIDSKFMWQGKCEMSDKTLERIKNHVKPQQYKLLLLNRRLHLFGDCKASLIDEIFF